MATKNTELATIGAAGALAPLEYAVLDIDPAEMGQMLAENTGGETISAFDLDRVKVPAGGTTIWSVPSLDGEEDLRTIEGVIIYQRTARSFWAKRMEETGGGTAPDCSSNDGIIGMGTPKLGDIEHPNLRFAEARYNEKGEEIRAGHFDCKNCPLGAFGSGQNGRSQACKQNRLIFLIREQSVLPMLIAAPPSSLRQMKQYMLRLSGAGVPFYGVVTALSLRKEKNADGIDYAEIVPSVARRLTKDDMLKMRDVSKYMAPILAAVPLEPEPEPVPASHSDTSTADFLNRMRAEQEA